MVVEGNHESERDAAGKSFQAYEARFRVPHKESNSTSPKYYSFDLAGERSTAVFLPNLMDNEGHWQCVVMQFLETFMQVLFLEGFWCRTHDITSTTANCFDCGSIACSPH